MDRATIANTIYRLRQLNPERPPKSRWQNEHKEQAVLAAAKWDKEHPQRAKARHKKYNLSIEGKVSKLVRRQRHRARMLEARGSFTAEEWELRKQEFDYRCVYCGSKRRKLTADHWIPLSKEGTNYIDNIVPACKKCNSHKYTTNGDGFKFPGRTQMIMAQLMQRRLQAGQTFPRHS